LTICANRHKFPASINPFISFSCHRGSGFGARRGYVFANQYLFYPSVEKVPATHWLSPCRN
jgi:hypothetical protein